MDDYTSLEAESHFKGKQSKSWSKINSLCKSTNHDFPFPFWITIQPCREKYPKHLMNCFHHETRREKKFKT